MNVVRKEGGWRPEETALIKELKELSRILKERGKKDADKEGVKAFTG